MTLLAGLHQPYPTQDESEGNPGLYFRWLGVNGLELIHHDSSGETSNLVIDPFFTRPGLSHVFFGRIPSAEGLALRYLPRIDHILVTHSHWDHLMDVPSLAKDTGAIVYGSPNTGCILSLNGVPETQFKRITADDHLDLGAFQVQVLAAEHMPVAGFTRRTVQRNLRLPLRLRDYSLDECFSFLIQAAGLRILIWCSAKLAPAPMADLLFAGVEPSRSFLTELITAVRPRLVIPLHWDDFFRSLEKPLRPSFRLPTWKEPFFRRMDLTNFTEKAGAGYSQPKVVIPEIFRTYPCVSRTA